MGLIQSPLNHGESLTFMDQALNLLKLSNVTDIKDVLLRLCFEAGTLCSSEGLGNQSQSLRDSRRPGKTTWMRKRKTIRPNTSGYMQTGLPLATTEDPQGHGGQNLAHGFRPFLLSELLASHKYTSLLAFQHLCFL